MVPLENFLTGGPGDYKYSFTFKSSLVVQLADAHFESEEWAARFRNDATKEEVLKEVRNNDQL